MTQMKKVKKSADEMIKEAKEESKKFNFLSNSRKKYFDSFKDRKSQFEKYLNFTEENQIPIYGSYANSDQTIQKLFLGRKLKSRLKNFTYSLNQKGKFLEFGKNMLEKYINTPYSAINGLIYSGKMSDEETSCQNNCKLGQLNFTLHSICHSHQDLGWLKLYEDYQNGKRLN